MKLPLAAAIAALLAQSATAQAPPIAADADSDVECLAATLLLSQTPENPNQQAAMSGMMYFLGKVIAQGIDYTRPLSLQMRTMSSERLQSVAERCGGEIETAGTDMQRRGAEIEASENAE